MLESSRLDLPTPVKLVVLASGSGTLLQALLDASERTGYPAKVIAVGTDRDGVEALARAERAAVPGFTVRLGDHPDRAAWDKALTEALKDPAWGVRRHAALALGDIGPAARPALPRLEALRKDPDSLVRKAAQVSAGKVKGPAGR